MHAYIQLLPRLFLALALVDLAIGLIYSSQLFYFLSLCSALCVVWLELYAKDLFK